MRSSLKFCLIANGEFDLYAANPRAREWDIAAGHAIAENAGAIVCTHNKEQILYGKADYHNPSLLVRKKVFDVKKDFNYHYFCFNFWYSDF